MFNFSNPRSVVEELGIGTSSVVVDLGSGSGHYSLAAADIVGSEGHVYAVDIQKDMLSHLVEVASQRGLSNIDVIHADIEQVGGTKLGHELADVVMICNTLFQTEEKASVLAEAKRLLRVTGRLLLVDWTDSHSGMGPHASMVFASDAARTILADSGFEISRELGAGAHHYGLVCRISSK